MISVCSITNLLQLDTNLTLEFTIYYDSMILLTVRPSFIPSVNQ